LRHRERPEPQDKSCRRQFARRPAIPPGNVGAREAHIPRHLTDQQRIPVLPAPRLHEPAEVPAEACGVIRRAAELALAIQPAAEADRSPFEPIAEIAALEDADLAAALLLRLDILLPPHTP